MTFFEALESAARARGGPLCVGIDPRIEPSARSREALGDYGRRVVDACAPYAAAFKPQLAFFECHGAPGWDALDDLLAHIRDIDADFPVILDAKRGDIGSTAEAYARSLLDRPGALAVTLSPYLGLESVQPFLRRAGGGLFVLCRTSNAGAGRLQEHRLDNGTPLYLAVADEALSWERQGAPAGPALRAGPESTAASPSVGTEDEAPFTRGEGPPGAAYSPPRTGPSAAPANPAPQRCPGALHPSDAPPRQIGPAAAGNDPSAPWAAEPPRRIGLVAAANIPGALAALRRRHPQAWFLAPGIGAQGGRPDEALRAGARHDGFGLLASASRSVADAPHPGRAARELKEAMDAARESLLSGKRPRTATAADRPERPAPSEGSVHLEGPAGGGLPEGAVPSERGLGLEGAAAADQRKGRPLSEKGARLQGADAAAAADWPERPAPSEGPACRRGHLVALNQAERLELLTGLFLIGAFQTGEFTLKSGEVSPFYIDLRRLGADPRLMQLAGRAYASLLDDIEAVHIAGIPVAALPLAAAAALTAGMSLIYPRLEKKPHGSGAAVEGLWKKGDHAVMLDDLITTGGSKREAAAVLRQAGLITQNLIVLIERGTEGRRDMRKAGIRLKSWARIEDLIDAGAQTGLLDPQTASQVRDYARAAPP